MRLIRKVYWSAFALFISATATAAAQDATCPTIVQDALAATDSACVATGRNQACYGNIDLQAQPQPGVADFNFTKPGDLVDVAGVQTLNLSPLDQKKDTWGVALLKLQANLPDTLPGQNVTFLLFGDVEIQNAVSSNVDEGSASVPAGTTLEVTVSSMSPLMTSLTNPNTAAMPKMLNAGTKVTADGYFATAQMLHVQLDDGTQGWLMAAMVKVNGDVNTLPAMDMDGKVTSGGGDTAPAPKQTPMQAFYFKSGSNDAPCDEAPDSGILIQTPEGAGKIELTINDAKIELGSTGYFQAQPGGDMTVTIVEGEGVVEADGTSLTVPAGSAATVPLDNNLKASGPPVGPTPYDPNALKALPVSYLPRQVDIAPALAEATLPPAVGGVSPVPGKWTSTQGKPTLGAGCPAELAQAMEQFGTFGQTSTFTIPEGEFTLEAVMKANDTVLPGGYKTGNPEPGVYTMDFGESGSTFHYEIRVGSPTEMNAVVTITIEGGCTMTLTTAMKPVGG